MKLISTKLQERQAFLKIRSTHADYEERVRFHARSMQSSDGFDTKNEERELASREGWPREYDLISRVRHLAKLPATWSRAMLGILMLLTVAFVYATYLSFMLRDPINASQCQMAYMSPGYIRLEGLDRQHSKYAGKYSLWLYREQGWDLSNKVRRGVSNFATTLWRKAIHCRSDFSFGRTKPHGIPVLFAPGNAGSHRQIRSLAAAAARQYYESPGQPRLDLFSAGHSELDFFAGRSSSNSVDLLV